MTRRHLFATLSLLGLLSSSVLGCSKSDPSTVTSSGGATVTSSSGDINVIANDKGFIPSSVAVKKGASTTLVFTRTTDDTCAKEVVFPELKVTKELPLNQKVAFDVPAADARTLTFQCGMGMFKGKVVIE